MRAKHKWLLAAFTVYAATMIAVSLTPQRTKIQDRYGCTVNGECR